MAQAVADQTLHAHLRELRRRGLWTFLVVAAGAGVGYYFRVQLVYWLQHPLHQHLYYTSPTGSFEFIMKLCLLVGIVAGLPVLLYHVLRYVEPAFTKRFSRKLIVTVISFSYLLAVTGVAFAYFVSLPTALHFFSSVSTGQITPLISVDQYFKFVFAYLVSFALVFQLPLILLFIDHVTPIGPTKLGKWRKFVVIGAFAVALITPSAPDPLSQIILALPILLLFEVTLMTIRIRHWRKNRKTKRTQPKKAPLVATSPDPMPRAAQPRPLTPAPRPLERRLTDHVLDLSQAAPPAPRKPQSNVLDLRQLASN